MKKVVILGRESLPLTMRRNCGTNIKISTVAVNLIGAEICQSLRRFIGWSSCTLKEFIKMLNGKENASFGGSCQRNSGLVVDSGSMC
mgnify:FL=1